MAYSVPDPRALLDVPAPGDAPLRVITLGDFRVWRPDGPVEHADWGRDKAVQLFQYLVTRRRRFMEREQIVDALWPELDAVAGDRDFKVALNAVQNALEPERAPRGPSRFIRRVGSSYALVTEEAWIDVDALEAHVAAGNRARRQAPAESVAHYRAAEALYQGDYLPARRYEDWSSPERERVQVLALGAMTTLAELLLDEMPLESIRLAQRVLDSDPVWEDAWRLQMRAHMARG
ncbi:MAG TPA: BTAD domain-containing putative transcriptional regulator, partial [Gemmatimonadales bacterium]|nr:BTAD domain-containing putative transcriptional regulator [Gemmatimonadales bacterium]